MSNVQVFEIHGERFVILPEREYIAMRDAPPLHVQQPATTNGTAPKFGDVTPVPIRGTAASETLIRDRQ